MKSIKLLLCAMAAGTMLASCAVQTIPQKLDEFVDDAESNAGEYSAEDWAQSNETYGLLLDEYLNSGEEYTEEEKQLAAEAMGRYHALIIRNGVNLAGEYLKRLGDILPSYLDGLASGIEENGGNIESLFNNLVDEEALDQSIDRLNDALEKIFENGE